MKQWISNQDGLDKLKLVEAPMPEDPKEGEVLVKINSVSLNFRDTEVCMGLYGHHKSIGQDRSVVPCSDICGTVVKVGGSGSGSGSGSGHDDNGPAWKEGDRVMATFNQTHVTGQIREHDMASGLGLPLPGCLAEYRVFPASGLVRAPGHLSADEAACLPIAAVTAWMAINSFQPLGQPMTGSDKVVLLQGTGGVSVSGLQIAKALGMTAIVTSSSDAKLEQARRLGADHTINYKTTPAWDAEVLRLTGGRGADVIFEAGGAQTLGKSFECVAFGGLISCFGYLSGKQETTQQQALHTNVLALKRNVTLKGLINGPRDRFEEMVALYEKAHIRPVVDRVFAFDRAADALQYLFQGGHFGKVVVQVQE